MMYRISGLGLDINKIWTKVCMSPLRGLFWLGFDLFYNHAIPTGLTLIIDLKL
jgi:hypothetical protein